MIRIRHLAFAAAALLLGVAATSPAEAAEARCGMTIRGKVKLTADLACNHEQPITLVGNRAHLDLNGFELQCGSQDQENPLRMKGQGSLIRNGRLYECTVYMLDRGDHKMRNVSISTWDFSSLVIRSNSNEVVYSGFGSDVGNPVRVESGNYNLIADSHISGEGGGMSIVNRTYVINNRFGPDFGSGLAVGGNFNRIFGNEFLEICQPPPSGGIDNQFEANTDDPDFCHLEPGPLS